MRVLAHGRKLVVRASVRVHGVSGAIALAVRSSGIPLCATKWVIASKVKNIRLCVQTACPYSHACARA